MPEFKIYCMSSNNSDTSYLYYNNESNLLLDKDRQPFIFDYVDLPINKEVVERTREKVPNKNTTIKIRLGGECNYSCSYCIQNVDFAAKSRSNNYLSVKEILDFIPESTSDERRFEFWGGEPFLFWDDFILPISEELFRRYPRSGIYIPTNGSLLREDMIKDIDRLGIFVSISHDGPGQWQRGGQPLNPPQSQVIQSFFRCLGPKNKISFNPVLTSRNASRRSILEWFKNEIGHSEFLLGEGHLITPSTTEHVKFTFHSEQDRKRYRRNFYYELRKNLISNFTVVQRELYSCLSTITRRVNCSNVGLSCGIENSSIVDLDIYGNLLTCKSFDANYVMPSGELNRYGSLSELGNAKMGKITSWTEKETCINCPVGQLCTGGCPFVPDFLFDYKCDNLFSDKIPVFCYALERLTGLIPYYIDGPLPKERKDIFGMVADNNYSSLFLPTLSGW